jgi:hypothetical protein
MATETNNSTCECPTTLQELLDDIQSYPDKFKHLQIILNRNDNCSMWLGQRYLVVNNEGFGLYQIQNINYTADIIQLELKNITSDELACVALDINDDSMHLILVCWNDIVLIVKKDDAMTLNNDDLSEFNY